MRRRYGYDRLVPRPPLTGPRRAAAERRPGAALAAVLLTGLAACREAPRGKPSAELGTRSEAVVLGALAGRAPELPEEARVLICTRWPQRAEKCDGWVRPRRLHGVAVVTGAQLHAVVRLQTGANTIPRLVGRPLEEEAGTAAEVTVLDDGSIGHNALVVRDADGKLAIRLEANLDMPP